MDVKMVYGLLFLTWLSTLSLSGPWFCGNDVNGPFLHSEDGMLYLSRFDGICPEDQIYSAVEDSTGVLVTLLVSHDGQMEPLVSIHVRWSSLRALCRGDYDGDGIIGQADFGMWQRQIDTSSISEAEMLDLMMSARWWGS
jgi:hypothetical protein